MKSDENSFLEMLSILALKQHHSPFPEKAKSERLSPLPSETYSLLWAWSESIQATETSTHVNRFGSVSVEIFDKTISIK